MTITFRRAAAYIALGLGTILGPGTVFAFWLFLFIGPLNLINLRLSEPALLTLNTVLSLTFFLQHSVLVRKSFRRWFTRFMPSYFYGTFYAITGGAVLLAVMVFWQESNQTLIAIHGASRWIFHALYIIAFAGFGWCIWALRGLDPFGLGPLHDHLRGAQSPPPKFIIRGPYRWVRHPVYFFWLVMFWSDPNLTADRLLLNLLWSGWIITATFLEERDLRASFGEMYADYQSRVPMLIPLRLYPFRQGSGLH